MRCERAAAPEVPAVRGAASRCRSLPWFSVLALAGLGPRHAAADSAYFVTLPFRGPTQCERMQCLSTGLPYCRDNLEGFYLKEKGCKNGMICTDCAFGNRSNPTICNCENVPYQILVSYGEACNAGKVCAPGEGFCYRPCPSYLHITRCPSSHCVWDKLGNTCVDKPPIVNLAMWKDLEAAGPIYGQGVEIVEQTEVAAFPIDFATFKHVAEGYRIQGIVLQAITELETVFLQLDMDNDGLVYQPEFERIPSVLARIDTALSKQHSEMAAVEAAAASATADEAEAESYRRLTLGNASITSYNGQYVTPELCGALNPRRYYCSFDISCKLNCEECGWKSAHDEAYSTCVRPTNIACKADNAKVYCLSDDRCHPPGNCTECVDRPIVDYSQSMCLAKWWEMEPLPLWTNWVCRFRNKVGMPCFHDQDCIHGLRRCLYNKCLPKQPYNSKHECLSDHDCPHLGFYCPTDPTGGANPYWIQYCRRQRSVGMVCAEDRECEPDLQCNTAEPQPRCRKLFSLEVGALAKADELCSRGWRDRDDKCAVPAKSKEAGRPCHLDSDCVTTDMTGRPGSCVCKAWWADDESRYCLPVAGDYDNHQESLRDFLYFKATKCGSFWTEDECFEVFGDTARKLKLKVLCETQTLAKGPYLPPADCGIDDYDRFSDYCAKLAAM